MNHDQIIDKLSRWKLDYYYNNQFNNRNAKELIKYKTGYDYNHIGSLKGYDGFGDLDIVPLMTINEELSLFRKFNYIKHLVNKYKGTKDWKYIVDSKLFKIYDLFETALDVRNEIVLRNSRLVIKYAKRFEYHFASANSLFSDGCVTLIRSVDGFDYNRGIRFNTYASRCIINGYVNQFKRMNKQNKLLFQQDDQDTSEKLINHDFTEYENKESHMAILSKFNILTANERLVLSNWCNGQSITSIGVNIGLSKERIRQIKESAICKLKESLKAG